MTITYPRPWPAQIGLQKSRFGLSKNEAGFSGELGRQRNTFSHAAGLTDRWEGVLTTPMLARADLGELTAMLTTLGLKNTIELFDPDRREALSGVVPGGGFTNWLLRPSAFDNVRWSDIGTPIVVADVDGIADSIEDNDAGAHEGRSQPITVPDDEATYTVSIRVKQTGTTVMGLDAVLSGGTEVSAEGRLDIAAGTTNLGNVVDETTYWRWDIPVTNDLSGNTTLTYKVFPSMRATLGGADDVTQVGTIIVKEAQVERAAVVGTFENTTTGPLVNGAAEAGLVLTTDGWLASSTVLFAGDYIQLGTGYHMITADAVSDGSGNATLDIEPALRSTPADNDPIIVINPVLIARLTTPAFSWEADERILGSVSFAFEEKVP